MEKAISILLTAVIIAVFFELVISIYNKFKNEEMKKNNMLFEWFKALGGNVNAIKTEEVNEILNPPVFKVSTFKARAKEIKKKYNHKFNFDRI